MLIEDESVIAQTLQSRLKSSYVTDLAQTGQRGLHLASVSHYDLIVLDLGLPDINGLEVCRQIRRHNRTPILILSGKGEIATKVSGLDAGADDYLMKPFNFDELLARIRALSRRAGGELTPDILVADGLTLNPRDRRVTRFDQPIRLRRKEFNLLEYLLRHRGQVVTREMILDQLWHDNVDLFTNAIDVHVNNLRDKVDKPFASQLIKTVHGLGYMIEAADS